MGRCVCPRGAQSSQAERLHHRSQAHNLAGNIHVEQAECIAFDSL